MLAPSFEGWELRVRRSRVLSVIVVGVAAIAVIATDVAVIPHRSHEIAVREATKRRAAYLEAVRPTLNQVYVALQPLEDALAQQAAESIDGIDFPVRDVLAHTTGAATFATAATSFDKIAAPKDMKVKAAAISTALHGLATDTKTFSTLATTDGEDLADSFATGTFSDLSADAGTLGQALAAAYGPEHKTAPALPSSAPPSHDSWLLAVDTACLVGENALVTRVDTPNETDAQYEQDLRISISAAATVIASIRKAPLGRGDQKAAALRARLGVADRAVAAQRQILATFAARNAAGYAAAIEANAAVLPDFAALGTAFGAYGATECAPFFGVSKTPSTGSSGSGGGQST